MDPIAAMHSTNEVVSGLLAGLTPEHKEMSTPCQKWTVHELIEHMCQGGLMIAGGLHGQAPPDDAPDVLANGPVEGWNAAFAQLSAAATPEALASVHQMPFGEVPGAVAVSVITADHIVHAWDLAKATGQDDGVGEELATFALETWKMVVPADGRTGDGFAPVVDVSDDASTLDKAVAYTGRQP